MRTPPMPMRHPDQRRGTDNMRGNRRSRERKATSTPVQDYTCERQGLRVAVSISASGVARTQLAPEISWKSHIAHPTRERGQVCVGRRPCFLERRSRRNGPASRSTTQSTSPSMWGWGYVSHVPVCVRSMLACVVFLQRRTVCLLHVALPSQSVPIELNSLNTE